MKQIMRWVILIIPMLLLSACVFPAPGNIKTWIDAPRLNTEYVVGDTIEIVAHATDHSGAKVQAIAFFLNGELFVTLPQADTGADLVTFSHSYAAEASGEFVLEAAAQNSAGQWGERVNTSFLVTGETESSTFPERTSPAENDPTQRPPSPTSLSPTAASRTPVPQTDTPSTAIPPTATAFPIPPTAVQPTATASSIPTTAVPPTATDNPPTSTPIPPTPTPVPDTEKPVILELLWSPSSPFEDEPVFFSVVAEDNVGVVLIEIYFVRQGDTNPVPIHTCASVSVCEYEESDGFPWGTYNYYAFAYDAAGNRVSTFIQTVLVQETVE